jgi:hypothetical protein
MLLPHLLLSCSVCASGRAIKVFSTLAFWWLHGGFFVFLGAGRVLCVSYQTKRRNILKPAVGTVVATIPSVEASAEAEFIYQIT